MLHELVVIANDIRVIVEYLKDGEQIPHSIPENILAILKKFKKNYDAKNINSLSKLISEDYESNILWGSTKKEFISCFTIIFKQVPLWTNLKLEIDIYQVLENNANRFKAIVDFKSDIALGFIPLQRFDSGEHVCVELAPDGEHGIWKIKSITNI